MSEGTTVPERTSIENLITKIDDTPGFHVQNTTNGYMAVNDARVADKSDEATSTGLPERTNDHNWTDTLSRLRRIGWTHELYRRRKSEAREKRLKDEGVTDVAAAMFTGTQFDTEPAPTPAEAAKSHPDDFGTRAFEEADDVSIYSLDAFKQCRPVPQYVDRKTAIAWTEKIPAYQRKRSPRTEKEYGRQMLRGEWAAILHGILRDPDGMPLDGQNRLFALIWATDPDNPQGNPDLTVPFMVWENVPRAMFRYIDKQRKRTTANTLQGLGEKNAFNLGTAVRLLYLYDRFPQSEWRTAIISDDQIVGHLDDNADLRKSMYWGKLRDRGIRYGAATVAHYVLMRHYTHPLHQRTIDAWFDRLHHGYNLAAGDPAAALRDYAMQMDKDDYKRLQLPNLINAFHLSLILDAWCQSATGERVNTLNPRKNFVVRHEFPTLTEDRDELGAMPFMPLPMEADA